MNQQEFENFIEKHEEEIIFLAELTGISVEAFKDSLRNLVVTFDVIVDNAMKIFNTMNEFITEIDIEKMERMINKRQMLYKLDLKRPMIKNQVINRKPRHLIKKIIY
ncbi:hypothetical protein [Lysinibacillus sp. FSL W8-0992]|uniref:hypothetical protein n=1 Tax=Lysinibacillus sp. FSL W8-0992 TaxID=2954643 RepID=UPI0030F7D782